MRKFNLCANVCSYVDKRYIVMRILNIQSAVIYVFDITYPLTIKWNDLKKIDSNIEFRENKSGKEYLTISLPLRRVIDITDGKKLSRFINKYINY